MIHPKDIYALLDLTYLKDKTAPNDITKLIQLAEEWQVAAVCLWPKDLIQVPKDFQIPKATVVNFPHGQQPVEQVLQEITDILQAFPKTEIDYVFNYSLYLRGDEKKALKECQQVVNCCHQHPTLVKVIVETGAFPNTTDIEKAARGIIDAGADMLKTSTGKISQGASLSAVRAFCKAISDIKKPCGIKVSGGIRSMQQASEYLTLIQTECPDLVNIRFGCSQLVNDLC